MGFRNGTIGNNLVGASLISSSLVLQTFGPIAVAQAQSQQFAPYCQQSLAGIEEKATLRAKAEKGDRDAEKQYKKLIEDHGKQLQACRQQNTFRSQGIWLRLYECDAKPGRIDEVLDKIVDRGYNEIYVETFFNGMVLLPKESNNTAWPSMLQTPGQEKRDLLAEVIRKGRDRGLKIHAWMFSMNFGYTYASRADKRSTLIKNGRGQTSIETENSPGLSTELGSLNPNEAFVDPYSPIARRDYLQMAQEVLKRQPDGMFFDYIRYPRLKGRYSAAKTVEDLWVYSESARSAMLDRAANKKGRDLIQRYIDNKTISGRDLEDIDRLYPDEATQPPLWQGRNPGFSENNLSLGQRRDILADELWRFSVAHTYQGVVDFLTVAATPAQQAGLRTGAVFFADGNQTVGNGYDSRLQPWDRFPNKVEFHPMLYANCGRADCVVSLLNRVTRMAPFGAQIKPVIAGIWQESVSNRPPLEVQMQALKQAAPQITEMSHFAFSWQEPLSDRDRKFCRIPLPPLKPR